MSEQLNVKLYCWYSKEISKDGLLMTNVDGSLEQLTTTDKDLIEYFRPFAERLAAEHGKKVYLVEFQLKDFVECLEPLEVSAKEYLQ